VSATQLFCPGDARRDHLRAKPIPRSPNGIDWVEVLPSKRALVVHCFATLPADIGPAQVRIEGGVRVRVAVANAFRADQPQTVELTAADKADVDALSAQDKIFSLIVRADSSGDFSEYTLRLVASTSPSAPPPAGFDPLLSEIGFSFKVDCPTDFDCREPAACPPDEWPTPRIDYLAKDYASFRRLMLDRLAQTTPGWAERNPADLQVTLVELLAFAADRLSYHQDAVATEAYLGTARRRPSVRRHARLADYRMHDGCNARAWLTLTSAAGDQPVPAGTYALSGELPAGSATVEERVLRAALAGAVAFRTRHPVVARAARNEIAIYTWDDPECCLPRGATRATLLDQAPGLSLVRGDVLVFEERRGHDGKTITADPSHRHAVRLVRDGVTTTDPMTGAAVVEVEWHQSDALPFALPVTAHEHGPAAVVLGNVVLADHGVWVQDPPVVAPDKGRFRPTLARTGLTHAAPYRHDLARLAPAADALNVDLDDVLPVLELGGEGETWTPARGGDLLGSDAFAADVVVEMEEDGTATVRFGDDRHGRAPTEGETFVPRYRIGLGPAGNVGARALNVLAGGPPGVTVTNPMSAVGGLAPEPLEDVRQYAPQAFRRQERAVTSADYATAAQRHPEVQRAAATRRWTGSWHTMFVTVDRLGGRPVDADFEARLRTHLDRFRLAGYDLEIDGPKLVALELKLWICLASDASRSTVGRAVRAALRDHFDPDNFTFGQPVYLAPVVAKAMGVPGVRQVTPQVFARYRSAVTGAPVPTVLELGTLEVARLDDDRSAPENGRIELELAGGR
jgi:Baseplate J-like protein